MKLLTLAKKLDFETEEQYFDYCIDSFINGQYQQCKKLFLSMDNKDRKGLLMYIANTDQNGIHSKVYLHYFNLL